MVDLNRFKSAQDLKLYLEALDEKQEKLSNELDDFSIGLFDPRRKERKAQKKELKAELQAIRSDAITITRVFKEYTTFDSKIFLTFLTNYLSLREKTQYGLLEDVEEDDFVMALATKTYPLNLFGEKYNIVTTLSNRQRLVDQGSNGSCFGDTNDIDDFLSVCKDGKYICLVSKYVYSLLSGTNLNSEYKAYPYLLDVAYELIDLKLNNHNISDSDRLNTVLSNMKPTHPYVPKK